MPDSTQYASVSKFYETLLAKGLDPEAAEFLVGRLMTRVTTLAIAQATAEIGMEKVQELGQPTPETVEEWQIKLESLYTETTGKDFGELMVQILDEQVAELTTEKQ